MGVGQRATQENYEAPTHRGNPLQGGLDEKYIRKEANNGRGTQSA